MKTTFRYQPEAEKNPYTGFTSFQHFDGEALYSDVIVDPANNMTETENLECYPVPAYVPQNGRAEGFYPASTVAYIRILWKEFEPQQGDYRYEVIEDILRCADAHGQTVMFRLMAHSTRACDDVPAWIRALVACPERPAGKRVKDSPTDPLFWQLFAQAVRKIGERFDGDPRLDLVDISLPGSWGEGHKLENFSDDILYALMDAYTQSFPHTQLLAQIGAPNLVGYVGQSCPVGWRGDGVGQPTLLRKTYPERFKDLPDDLWKSAPVSFESYWWLGEWKRQGWDPDEIFAFLLDWHATTFNAKSLPIPLDWKEKVTAFERKMGYHFKIVSFEFPDAVQAGNEIRCTLTVENVGVAPNYHEIPLLVRCTVGGKSITFQTDADIRKWLPGSHTVPLSFTLPADATEGTAKLEIGIMSEDQKTRILFCSDAPRDGAWFRVGEIAIRR